MNVIESLRVKLVEKAAQKRKQGGMDVQMVVKLRTAFAPIKEVWDTVCDLEVNGLGGVLYGNSRVPLKGHTRGHSDYQLCFINHQGVNLTHIWAGDVSDGFGIVKIYFKRTPSADVEIVTPEFVIEWIMNYAVEHDVALPEVKAT